MKFLGGLEHWFARAAHESMVIGEKIVATQGTVNKDIEAGVAIASVFDPAQAIAITTIGAGMEMVWGKVCAAIHLFDNAVAKGEQKTATTNQSQFVQIPADPAFLQAVRDAMKHMEYMRPGTLSVANALLPAITIPPKPVASTAPPPPFMPVYSGVPQEHTPDPAPIGPVNK